MSDASFELPADASLFLSMEGGVAGQVVNNLTTTDAGFALDARQGRILNEAKLDKSSVDNSLTVIEAGRALDARQGKWLDENKVGFDDIENTLTSTNSSRVLSAAQGKVLSDQINEIYERGVSLPIAVATSTNGVDYVATVPGVTTIPRGYTFVLVPSVASTGTRLTLNVNGTGAKTIRRLLSSASNANNAVSTMAVGYFNAARPVTVQYDSYASAWVVVGGTKPSADDLHGTLPLAKGGTGASTAKEAEYTINGGIAELTDAVGDGHSLVFAYGSPSAGKGVFYRRSVSQLWSYIAGKIRGSYIGYTTIWSGTATSGTEITFRESLNSFSQIAVRFAAIGSDVVAWKKGGAVAMFTRSAFNDNEQTFFVAKMTVAADGLTGSFPAVKYLTHKSGGAHAVLAESSITEIYGWR